MGHLRYHARMIRRSLPDAIGPAVLVDTGRQAGAGIAE